MNWWEHAIYCGCIIVWSVCFYVKGRRKGYALIESAQEMTVAAQAQTRRGLKREDELAKVIENLIYKFTGEKVQLQAPESDDGKPEDKMLN